MPVPHWQENGAWLSTSRGFRQLLPEEFGNALGIDKPSRKLISSGKIHQVHTELLKTTSIFHWECLSGSLIRLLDPTRSLPLQVSVHLDVEEVPNNLTHTTFMALRERAQKWKQFMEAQPCITPTPFTWNPPNLEEGGAWYKERWKTLEHAVTFYPAGRQADLLAEGFGILKVHRGNYDSTGAKPQELQLIWWEFPQEHWDPIREGSPMNFLGYPPSIIHPNGKMDIDALTIAGAFADELIALRVLVDPPQEGVKTNAPIFAIPKAGQPGEYRVICNMKEGGQNDYISGDPVYLNRPSHILSQMYYGGWSAVVDASKFFYQFKTHPDDRPYLGTLHPITNRLYVYSGLPMGSGNSPALAGRYGLAFLRLLREHYDSFGSTMRANCWWTSFRELGYDPTLGYGIIMERADGRP
jgi:hypothetical protein